MTAASRFVELSNLFLDNLLDNCIPEKTKTATEYGMKIFNGKLTFSYQTKLRAFNMVST